MIISFAESTKSERSGKHKFLARLAKSLDSKGHNICGPNKKADIFLHIGRDYKPHRAKKSIIRVDGLILNSDHPYKKMNRKSEKAIESSNAIVYQTKFCRNAYERFMGVKKKNRVINNGASLNEFLPRNVDNFFLCNCRWRPHKRLKNICKAFEVALNKGLDADLIITGEVEKKYKHPRIKYTGRVDGKKLRKLLSRSIGTVHIAWLDWCPNAMVESIVADCPVIYSDSGGSEEVGRGSGIPIKDTQWDFKKTVRLYKPPRLDYEIIANAMIKMKNEEITVDRNRFDINIISDQYLKFFEEVL